jgi:hypothetical protein
VAADQGRRLDAPHVVAHYENVASDGSVEANLDGHQGVLDWIG